MRRGVARRASGGLTRVLRRRINSFELSWSAGVQPKATYYTRSPKKGAGNA